MVRPTRVLMLAALAIGVLSLTACERTINHTETTTQALACTDCHVSNNLITGKETQWAESVHGTGEAYLRGTSASCAGCHSGNGFQERITAGLDPNEVTAGDPNPTRQDCRACHMIHQTYTMNDFTLRTTTPVTLYAINNPTTFDGGEGNLCVNCHQPRRDAPVAVNGMITGISEHWGPHHGPQSAMLLGIAGAGVTGSVSPHYGAVENTCVHCHMGDDRNHHFEPVASRCQKCHPGTNNFDINGKRTQVLALTDSLGAELYSLGLISENSEDGHPIVSSASENEGIALWNWIYVSHEDKSEGAHNAPYAIALLEEGLARLAAPAPAPATGRVVAAVSSH